MRVLIACESSGVVRRAFAALGHDAVSCDLLPAEDGETSQHVTGDVLPLLSQGWDLLIAHPPCTYLCGANAGHMRHGCSLYTAEQAVALRDDAARFFMAMVDAPIEHIAVENPVGCMSSRHRKPDQYLQPWQFGDPESKKTCLWLKNLPPLKQTNVLPLPECGHWANQTPSGQSKLSPSADRWRLRSKTYQGIADAMAQQWGAL